MYAISCLVSTVQYCAVYEKLTGNDYTVCNYITALQACVRNVLIVLHYLILVHAAGYPRLRDGDAGQD